VVACEGGGMTLAFLGQLGDAIEFIFNKSEGPGGAQVGGSQLLPLLREHLLITFAAVGIATAIALPIGTWLGHSKRGSFLVISVTNAGRAVPSLGVVFLFFAILGAGFFNITLALILLAIPPILLNAYTGVRAVDPEAVDAANGMGFTGSQVLRKVELPLALPLIFGGIKTSTVNVLATATLGPEAGVVTLGDPIINPSSYGEAGRLGAAILVAALAIVAEVGLSAVQRRLTPQGLKLSQSATPRRRLLAISKRRIAPTS
jgi:osmoprotectant transport system permease protein